MTTPQLIADAEQLMMMVAPVDLAGGFAIVPGRPADDRLLGWSVGNGQPLAAAAGLPAGTTAVGVNVDGIRQLVETTGDAGDEIALAMLVKVAAHEAAHALVGTADAPLTLQQLDGWLAVPDRPVTVSDEASHHHRWAAAYGLLLNRSARHLNLLAAVIGVGSPADAHHDLHHLLAALGPVPLDASIRDLLTAGSPASQRVENIPTPSRPAAA